MTEDVTLSQLYARGKENLKKMGSDRTYPGGKRGLQSRLTAVILIPSSLNRDSSTR